MSEKRSRGSSDVKEDGFDIRVMKMPQNGSVQIIAEIHTYVDDDHDIPYNAHTPIGMIAVQSGQTGSAKNGVVVHGYPITLIIQFDAGSQETDFTLDIKDPDTTAFSQTESAKLIQMPAGQDVYSLTFTPSKTAPDGITFTLYYNGNACWSLKVSIG